MEIFVFLSITTSHGQSEFASLMSIDEKELMPLFFLLLCYLLTITIVTDTDHDSVH